MSFQTQLNHEVTSFSLLNLIKNKDKLAHLGDIEPVLANYELYASWFSSRIIDRRDSMEMCSDVYPLKTHLALKETDVSPRDRLAFNSIDAHALSIILRR